VFWPFNRSAKIPHLDFPFQSRFTNLETSRIVPSFTPLSLTRDSLSYWPCALFTSSSRHHRHVRSCHILVTLVSTLTRECRRQAQTSSLLHTYSSRWLTDKMRKHNTISRYSQIQASLQRKIVQAAQGSATMTTSKTLQKWLSVLPRLSSWLETNRLRYTRHLRQIHSFTLTHQGRSGHSQVDLPRKRHQDHAKFFRSSMLSATSPKSYSTSQHSTWIQLPCSRSTPSLVVSTTWSTRDTQHT
jgi:hypothetical protein